MDAVHTVDRYVPVSYRASLLVQVLSLAFCASTLLRHRTSFFLPPSSSLLLDALRLETAAQAIQLAWYAPVVAYFSVSPSRSLLSVPPLLRYVDWIITTPVMLVSVFASSLGYLPSSLVPPSVLSLPPSLSHSLVLAVLFNVSMLLFGVLIDTPSSSTPFKLPDSVSFFGSFLSLAAAFACLATAFLPLLASPFSLPSSSPDSLLASHPFPSSSALLLAGTASLWSLYGLSRLLLPPRLLPFAYNSLDILSKNLYGVGISAALLFE